MAGPQRRRQQARLHLVLLAAAAFAASAAAAAPKTVKVIWTPPNNRADEMDRPKLLTCGDTLQLKCSPGERHGVFKIANVTGACPKNFASPVAGDLLLPPTQDCDFKVNVTAGDNYFLTSQVPSECHNGMKMLVKVYCDSGATTTAKLKLGNGVARASNRTALTHAHSDATGHVTSGAARRGGVAMVALGAAAAVAAVLL